MALETAPGTSIKVPQQKDKTMKLGRLERLNLRDVWPDEAKNFTPWLAEKSNLSVLGETLDMELELEATEKSVGSFSADLLCTNTDDNSLVLVENQLERSDHPHLGKLMTYAAGLHTVNIVWVAAKFTEEHRAAMDWLNEITDVRFRFFGLEIELWRIDKSPAAPKFNIVSKPNDWSRTVGRTVNLTAQQSLQLAYWQSLIDFANKKNSTLRFPKARHEYVINLGIGRKDTKLLAILNKPHPKTLTVGFESHGKTAKAFYDILFKQKEKIESELGFCPDWNRRNDITRSQIWLTQSGDFTDKSSWPDFHRWMIDKLEAMDRVLRPRIETINLADWVPPDDSQSDDC